MPIPAEPTYDSVTAAVVALFRQVHDQVRDEIAELDSEDLNWSPVDDANTIATIVTHLVGSEAETLRVAAGAPCERNRDAEFVRSASSQGKILRLLDDADALLDELMPSLAEATLWQRSALPTLPAHETRPVISWLIANYGHAREHVGHIQITKQLRRASLR